MFRAFFRYNSRVCACELRANRLNTPIGISVPSTVATVFSPSIFFSPHPESIPIAITPASAATVVFFTIFFISITNYPFTDAPLRHATKSIKLFSHEGKQKGEKVEYFTNFFNLPPPPVLPVLLQKQSVPV